MKIFYKKNNLLASNFLFSIDNDGLEVKEPIKPGATSLTAKLSLLSQHSLVDYNPDIKELPTEHFLNVDTGKKDLKQVLVDSLNLETHEESPELFRDRIYDIQFWE